MTMFLKYSSGKLKSLDKVPAAELLSMFKRSITLAPLPARDKMLDAFPCGRRRAPWAKDAEEWNEFIDAIEAVVRKYDKKRRAVT